MFNSGDTSFLLPRSPTAVPVWPCLTTFLLLACVQCTKTLGAPLRRACNVCSCCALMSTAASSSFGCASARRACHTTSACAAGRACLPMHRWHGYPCQPGHTLPQEHTLPGVLPMPHGLWKSASTLAGAGLKHHCTKPAIDTAAAESSPQGSSLMGRKHEAALAIALCSCSFKLDDL